MTRQHTIKHHVSCVGIGLHNGKTISLSMYPAPEDTGIKFIRTDVQHADNVIYARYDAVSHTALCTTICNTSRVEVNTIEHILAALWAYQVDNVIVELDGAEIPIMDGSAHYFASMLEYACVVSQEKKKKVIKVIKDFEVVKDESRAVIKPAESLTIDAQISFADNAIGTQQHRFCEAEDSFKESLSLARTFGFKSEGARLKKAGYALGASLDNAVVVDDGVILNKNGLFYQNEFVRHKVLDLLGDLYLAGLPIKAEINVVKPGHAINNKILHSMFARNDLYVIV